MLTFRALVVFWFPAGLLFVNIVFCCTLKQISAEILSLSARFLVWQFRIQLRLQILCPIPPQWSLSLIDEDSAYTEANDSLRVLLPHGKRQSVEMNASGSVDPW